MKIKKSLLLYCFKADTYDDYLRRIELVAKWLVRRYNKSLIAAMFIRNIVTFNDIIKKRWINK